MSSRRTTSGHWLDSLPAKWEVIPSKAAFVERRQRSTALDAHLTPSQKYGVLPQTEYMQITGTKVVLNLEGQDNMKHVEVDDFVIHLRSFQGGIEWSKSSGKVSMAYTVLTPRSENIMPGYYRWLLKADAYIQELRSITDQLRDGQSIKYSTFAKIPLPLPPLDEQRAIADYLDEETARIDALVAKQEEFVRLLHERRSGLIAAGVTGRNFGEDVADGESWIGSPPSGWLLGKVKHFGTVTLGKMLQSSDKGTDLLAPYMRAANVQPDGVLALDDVKSMWFSPRELRTLDLQSGDVVVVEGGVGGYGRAAYIAEHFDGWGFQNSINRIRPFAVNDGRYLTYFLLMARQKGFISAYCNIVSMPHLTSEKLETMPMFLPPPAVQGEIADRLDEQTARIDALIAKAEEHIALAKERRSVLITAAVTGQLDVRTARKAG